MKRPLSVILLWHMHQPQYKDPANSEYILPWTYLHAVKDYYDMAAIVDEVDGARAVFNFVPSLLEQLEDYAAGTAVDPFLIHAKMDPAEMGEKERLFVITNFFAANRQRLIEPNRRYAELFQLAGDAAAGDTPRLLRQFRDQEILDLQVCFRFVSRKGAVPARVNSTIATSVRRMICHPVRSSPANETHGMNIAISTTIALAVSSCAPLSDPANTRRPSIAEGRVGAGAIVIC